MKWSNEAWNAIQPVYNRILELPFIEELINGTLAKEKFDFYIQQDAIYLSEYSKVLAGIASKLDKPEHMAAFIHFAGDSVAVEQSLHQSFMPDVNNKNEKAQVAASPDCLLYTSFLKSQLAYAPVEVALAAVLPCFWIYKNVGDYLLANQTKGHNPYQQWIDTYGGEAFEKSVNSAISICNQVADGCTKAGQKTMTEAFVMCAKLEWLFWDSAYKQTKWKI